MAFVKINLNLLIFLNLNCSLHKTSSINVLCVYIACKSKINGNNSKKDGKKGLGVSSCKVFTLHMKL